MKTVQKVKEVKTEEIISGKDTFFSDEARTDQQDTG
jgi:hypothetical protein